MNLPAIAASISSAVCGQRGGQVYQLTVGRNPYDIFNANAKLFFRDINPWLDGEHCPTRNRGHVIPNIVYFQPDVMAEPVNEVLAQRLAVQVLPVRIDVVVGDLEQGIRSAA